MAIRLEEWSEDDHLSVIRWNVLFPTFLTRAFLSSLRKTSLSSPVLVVFNSSFSPEFAVPNFPLYPATDAFVQRLPSCLSINEKIVPGESKIEFMHLHVGPVHSNTTPKPTDSSSQTSDDYAAHIVKAFGSGREDVVPLATDKIQLTITRNLPGFVQQEMLKKEAGKRFTSSKEE